MKREEIIIDADALMDIYYADVDVLVKLTKIYRINILRQVIRQIDVLNPKIVKQCGLIEIKPKLSDYNESVKISGGTNEQDNLCMINARRKKVMPVTNDRQLRKLCKKNEVTTGWGLDIILEANKKGILCRKDCIYTAKKIGKNNPFFITGEIISKFTEKLK